MTNEEFQELVLKELRKHSEQFDKMNGEITGIKGEITGINGKIEGINGEIIGINGKIEGINGEIIGIKGNIEGINGEITGIKRDINGITGEIIGINGKIEGINEEIIGIKGDINGVKGQLDENTQIVKAIQHNQEFSNAKLACIELTTAKAQSLSKLDDKFEALNKRLFAQEAEIQGLKRVK